MSANVGTTTRDVYQQAIAATHADDAPWYLIPADDKWTMRAAVAAIVTVGIGPLGPAISRTH